MADNRLINANLFINTFINNMRKEELKRQDSEDQQDTPISQKVIQHHQQLPLPTLPQCSYCTLTHQPALVICLHKSCKKTFCNLKGSLSASHIIMHLVRAKHNQISTFQGNDLGKISLECYICGNRNLFTLGSVDVKMNGKDQNVVMLCRNPCMAEGKYHNLTWEVEQWKALIQDKSIVDFLFENEVPQNYKYKIRQIKAGQAVQMEQQWKNNPELTYAQIFKKQQKKYYKPLQMFYNSGKHYRKIFQPLLQLQAETDKKIKQSQTQTGVTVKFDLSNKKRYLAYFLFASKDDYQGNLLPGNELKLNIKTQKFDWQSSGVVIRISSNEQICMQLQNQKAPPPIEVGYKVEFIWKSTSYSRMMKGLNKFVEDQYSISSYLFYKILGEDRQPPLLEIEPPKQKEISAPNLPVLNPYQKQALLKSLTQPLCLIQGPPGTGKTITSASIIYHLVNNKKRKSKVLVCAPSNVVVDMLAERIDLTGVSVVRFCSKSRQNIASSVQKLTLHYQTKNLKNPKFDKLKQYYQTKQQRQLSNQQQRRFKKLKIQAQNQILQKVDVICATCIASADPRLSKITFLHVLVDESTQAIQPQCLLPMLKGAKHAILVGDHQQLGPVVISTQSVKAGLNKSLFERFAMLGHRPIRLQVQYRMHPILSVFPSDNFYQGSLQNGVSINDRPLNKQFPWPGDKAMFFLNVMGTEEISASGTSFLNRVEAGAVQKISYYLGCSGIQSNQIGIITPYKGQRAFIINYLGKNGDLPNKNRNFYSEIEIASVDGYQGRQKDYIIISCVRSNQGSGIGFLTDPRRLNVMLTRAKYGLIIIGNAKVLGRVNIKSNKDKIYWNKLLHHFKQINALVQGNIPNFKQSNIVIKKIDTQEDNNKDQQQMLTTAISQRVETPMISGVRFSALSSTNQGPSIHQLLKQ